MFSTKKNNTKQNILVEFPVEIRWKKFIKSFQEERKNVTQKLFKKFYKIILRCYLTNWSILLLFKQANYETLHRLKQLPAY